MTFQVHMQPVHHCGRILQGLGAMSADSRAILGAWPIAQVRFSVQAILFAASVQPGMQAASAFIQLVRQCKGEADAHVQGQQLQRRAAVAGAAW